MLYLRFFNIVGVKMNSLKTKVTNWLFIYSQFVFPKIGGYITHSATQPTSSYFLHIYSDTHQHL